MDFDDINTAWADTDILIYTGTLSVGCSFTGQQFKRLFAYFHSQLVDYMVTHQMLRQVRNIESYKYHMYMWANCARKNDSCADIEKIVSTIGLIEQILMENKIERIGAINMDLYQPQYINRINIDNFTKRTYNSG